MPIGGEATLTVVRYTKLLSILYTKGGTWVSPAIQIPISKLDVDSGYDGK